MRTRYPLKVADEVWIATALLHRENPDRDSFSASEIVDRLNKEHLTETIRPGVSVHVYQHSVANRRPNPGNHRMLYATTDGGRRLFREGDDYHPYRAGGRLAPSKEDLPAQYRTLVDWYEQEYSQPIQQARRLASEETPSLWDRIREIWDAVPEEEMKKIPRDGAECHDHYVNARR
jgi:hypothetical protein